MNSISERSFASQYPLKRRLWHTFWAVLFAVLLAGFWNYHLVDGFGKEVIAGNTIGNTSQLADDFAERGSSFGFLFAAIAGLAATFTACNCVVFAMIPGLACPADKKSESGWSVFGIFVLGVLSITAIYGLIIGFLGAENVRVLNERTTRLSQAQIVFTALGALMFIWGLLEMGLLNPIKNAFSPRTRDLLKRSSTKALILGVFVGLFAVGRPFPVFREFLLYAASAGSPLYGSAVMMIQGIGQIAFMALLFMLLLWLAGDKIAAMSRSKPYNIKMISSLALIAGGAYFIYYWGLAFLFDIGQWGFKLGWY